MSRNLATCYNLAVTLIRSVNGIRAKIDQEIYILNKLVQSLSLSENNLELILQQMSNMPQKDVEDVIYKISPSVKGFENCHALSVIKMIFL